MVLILAELIFIDSPTRNNRELTEFLKRNLEKVIVKGGVQFKYKIAKSSDIPNIRKRNIKRLPAMVLQGRNFIGVPDIINELSKRVKMSKTSVPKKTDEEFIDEFFKSTLNSGVEKGSDGKIVVPDDDDAENPGKLEGLAINEMKRRGLGNSDMKPGQRAPPPKHPDRAAEQDDDYEDSYVPRNPPKQQITRQNNLEGPGDAFDAIDKLAGRGGGDTDDDLLKTLLLKMGDE